MKRKIFNIGLAVAMMFYASSCGDDFLDVNTDPNNPLTAPAELVFPAGVASTASVVGGNFAILGGIWSQVWTQNNGSNQYKTYDAYNLRPTDFQNSWGELYAGALNDYKYVKEEADAKANNNLYLMATVMEAYTYQVLTDLYDQIPFEEALQGLSNLTPKYNTGQEVYDGITARVTTALNRPTTGTSLVGENDIVFGGEMNSWKQFANTLLLKIYLRQSEARPGIAEAGVRSLYTNGANFLNTDAKVDLFVDQTGKRNPLFEQDQSAALNTNQNLKASTTMFTFLDANDDPRLEAFYIAGNAGQKALEQGAFNTPSTLVAPLSVSRARISPTAPVYLISEAESYFLQAEAVVRGWGTGDAQQLYEAGVRASYAQLVAEFSDVSSVADPILDRNGRSDSTANAKLAGVYAFPATGSTADKIKAIITQKWVALGGSKQGIEGYLERNRTNIPATSAVGRSTATGYIPGEFVYPVEGVTGNGNFAARLLTPETERTRNPNAAGAASKTITDKVWWDVN
ncbi:SusD/RagB family nutrient-binding outer membrane lipoprotein [Adhaeribacter sp. BT258]|uniref:SusD/RagB family nutrient-binding outer membrane lipoprotein n=1 Tax=Adhaeribacter terrigena TaxID=2793070 RepID=A0ABS1BYI7_9BACT|nr:SusD/RagB family nutrient-binding outer membrane lipoprotein [Adhaeribacter terrigena]MBK0401991.1 SusD/RagB family nutrient-binding outer membrane lipoprotein [Adhaeribacter terrigena]